MAEMDRRDFLKTMAGGAAAATGLSGEASAQEVTRTSLT